MSQGGGGCGAILVIGLVAFGIYRCSQPSEVSAVYDAGNAGAFQSFDEDAAREVAQEEAMSNYSGMTYQDAGAPYGCTDDCGGHDAGWQWAIDNGVTDESDCWPSNNSNSFEEGCRAYVESINSATDAAVEDAENGW